MSITERINKISENKSLSIDTEITTAKIELTGICTLKCHFCANRLFKETNQRQKLITDKEFSDVLNSMKEIKSLKEVGLFYMGESGLHPDLDKYYRELKQAGYFTYLTTNGTFIDNVLKAIPYIDSLKISWNYKDVSDFENKTGSNKNVYNDIINNIGKLYTECHRNNKTLSVSTILDTDKESYREALRKFMFDEHYFLPLQGQGGTISGEPGVVGTYDNAVSPLPCWSLFKGLYIDVDMNVRCCCYGHAEKHVLGNLKDNNINSILDKANKIKTQQLSGDIPDMCAKCLI